MRKKYIGSKYEIVNNLFSTEDDPVDILLNKPQESEEFDVHFEPIVDHDELYWIVEKSKATVKKYQSTI